MKIGLATLVLFFFMSAQVFSSEDKGTLIIAGGALSSSSMEVYETFTELAGGKAAKIGIVPAATSSIRKRFNTLSGIFSSFGVKPDNIVLLPLAVKDDSTTEDIDESQWVDNGNSMEVVNTLESLDAIWFVGGDQTLITRVLRHRDGRDTWALSAIRKVYERGGVIGGTSAGAAVMSEVMIAGGSSIGALLEGAKKDDTSLDEPEYGPVVVTGGLGFFHSGIIDQHFDRKARLGRLIVALLDDPTHDMGFGVDEGTALVVNNNQLSVIGSGGVTLVDTSMHISKKGNAPFLIENVRLSYLQVGDTFDLKDQTFHKREKALATIGSEYFSYSVDPWIGVMSANRDLDEMIGYDLVDNREAKQVLSWLLLSPSQGVKLTFSQDEKTFGYWSQDISKDIYSFEQVRLDIEPVQIRMQSKDESR